YGGRPQGSLRTQRTIQISGFLCELRDLPQYVRDCRNYFIFAAASELFGRAASADAAVAAGSSAPKRDGWGSAAGKNGATAARPSASYRAATSPLRSTNAAPLPFATCSAHGR